MLPEGWTEATLGEVAKISGGSTPSKAEPTFWGGNIRWLTPSEVTAISDSKRYVSETRDHITEKGLQGSSLQLYPAGTVLMTSRATIGEVVINTEPMTTNQGFCNFVPTSKVTNLFLAYWLTTGKPKLLTISSGSTFLEISKTSLRALNVWLPPLPEQKRIAEVLVSVDAAIDATKAVINQTKTVKQGLLQTLLTRGIGHTKFKDSPLGGIPESWEVKTLGEISIGKPEYGANVSAIAYDPALPRYIRITDIDDNGNLIPSASKSISESDAGPYLLSEDDFLFARSGATVGKTYRHKLSNGICAFAGYLIRFVFDKCQVLPNFVEEITRSEMYRAWIRDNLRAGAQPNINAQEYSSFVIALPPLSEQNQICGILQSLNDCLSLNIARLAALQTLKKGLMDDLLTGRVRVGVPAEKPATNVVPFPVQVRTPIRKQALLAAEITAQLYDLQKFGVTKREKIMDICDRHVGLNDRTERRAARREFGSYDEDARHAIDGIFENENWFKIRTETKNGHNIYKYGRGTNFRAHVPEFDAEFGDVKSEIQHIIDLLRDQDTRQCEIIDTLYTAWNDLIIERKARNASDFDISNDEIFKEVLDWHPSKGKISKTEWEWGMRWLRQKDLIPTGKGLSSKLSTLL